MVKIDEKLGLTEGDVPDIADSAVRRHNAVLDQGFGADEAKIR